LESQELSQTQVSPVPLVSSPPELPVPQVSELPAQ